MESYANIAAANAPPSNQQVRSPPYLFSTQPSILLCRCQPHPDPALLTTPSVLGGSPPDFVKKVNVVQSEYEQPPPCTTSESPSREAGSPNGDSASKRPEAPTLWRWEEVKEVILQPSITGGLVGIGGFLLASGINKS
jgi:hypothetical protein